MKNRCFAAALVVMVVVVSGYWHYPLYLASRSKQQAADAGDADRFNQPMGYKALPESVKGYMTAAIAPDQAHLGRTAIGAYPAGAGTCCQAST